MASVRKGDRSLCGPSPELSVGVSKSNDVRWSPPSPLEYPPMFAKPRGCPYFYFYFQYDDAGLEGSR